MTPPPGRDQFGLIAVVVLDSVGCGLAPDAELFGDLGTNTLAHVIESQGLLLPNLQRLGLGNIEGVPLPAAALPAAAWGRMIELAPGKDTMLGHWEIMGVVAEAPAPLYPQGFPPEIIEPFRRHVGGRVLGNEAASGTEIIERLGSLHMRTGAPIVYTSGDSVFQIAAHEAVIPVPDLYAMCYFARDLLCGEHAVGRVIARPFVGEGPGSFRRTAGRKDLPLPPPRRTALDQLARAGVGVHAVGKIHDIFAGRGITSYAKTADNAAGIAETMRALRQRAAPVIFTNLVDFDSSFGHRNDPAGYAGALKRFDRSLPELLEALPEDGCLLITADHGNDPTTAGTDHSRECVPLLATGRDVVPVGLGARASFADVGATLLQNFGIAQEISGEAFLSRLLGAEAC